MSDQQSSNNFSRATTFLNLVNRLEQLLDELNQSTQHVSARRLVESLSKDYPLLDTYKLDLIEFLELRNAIVHKTTGNPIAEPHQQVIDQLHKIIELLEHPPTAMAIAATPVYSCNTTDHLQKVLAEMNRSFYTSIPVYHDNRFVGVFSYKSVAQWLMQQDGAVDLGEVLISQIQNHFDQQGDKYNSYQFMSTNTDVYTIRREFTAFTKEKKRLGAIFITAHGKKDEKIEGIITAWDLPKIPVNGR